TVLVSNLGLTEPLRLSQSRRTNSAPRRRRNQGVCTMLQRKRGEGRSSDGPWGRRLGYRRAAGARRRRPDLEWLVQPDALEDRVMLSAIRNLPGFAAHVLPAIDDISIGSLPLGFNANFFGVNVSNIAYVNNNGSLTFGDGLNFYDSSSIIDTHHIIIAPFLAD